MRADVVIASVIAIAGAMAIGQAVSEGLTDPPAQNVGRSKGEPTPPVLCATHRSMPAKDRAISFAAVGDTVTAWRTSKGMNPQSWVTYAAGSNTRLAGGFARPGIGTERISLGVKPVEADVLVLMTGTNDLMFPFAYDNVERSLQRTVDTVGIDRVLVSSIPPVDAYPAKTKEFNEYLARIAYRHDWSFVDAGSTVRGSNCRYRPGLTSDGIVPTREGARLIGEAIRSALTTRQELATAG